MTTPKIPTRRDLLKLKVERPDGVYQIDNYHLSESLGFLLKRGAAQLAAMLDQDLAPYDLTHPQFSILMMLKHWPLINCVSNSSSSMASSAEYVFASAGA